MWMAAWTADWVAGAPIHRLTASIDGKMYDLGHNRRVCSIQRIYADPYLPTQGVM